MLDAAGDPGEMAGQAAHAERMGSALAAAAAVTERIRLLSAVAATVR